MPRTRANPDINARQFRNTCHDERFAWLGGTAQRFIDLDHPVPGRTILPVRNARGQILHAATLTALRASRAASEQEKQREAADAQRRLDTALRLAPQALNPARAGLDDAQAVAVMADDFRALHAAKGSADWPDMLLLGWTKAQLKQHGDLARQAGYQLEGAH